MRRGLIKDCHNAIRNLRSARRISVYYGGGSEFYTNIINLMQELLDNCKKLETERDSLLEKLEELTVDKR